MPNAVINYILMHKNIPVADITIDKILGGITHIGNIKSVEHLPIGVHLKNGTADRLELNNWWSDRAIPLCRPNVKNILAELNIKNVRVLSVRSLGLSLSDCYWIKPVNSNFKWEKINFFDNNYSEDIGNLLFGEIKNTSDLFSPDSTCDGCLKKRWEIINNKRYLLKAGNGEFRQQPFNEAIASVIMDRLNVPHAACSVIWRNEEPYSLCEDFLTPETELISAWRVMQIRGKKNHESYYMHYAGLCKEFGINDIEHSLDMMLVIDYIIANEDRHFNNFGIVRNSDTLEWIGTAPIFDSGTSLGYNKISQNLFSDIWCKPFKKTHNEQLQLVKSFDWINFSKLYGVEKEISEIMSSNRARSVLGEMRHKEISNFVKERIARLEKIALKK